MRKVGNAILTAAAVALASSVAGAQTMYDAINFSRNDYFGTARSMAMGNAVTAVGGDLGTIGINPAGSAVATYGQFVITPGISVSAVSSAYSPVGETNYGPYTSSRNSRLTLPNVGISMSLETGRSRGLKSVSFAVVSNQTSQYNYYANAYGQNSWTSKSAEFAAAAAGVDESVLSNYNSYESSSVPWDVLAAYQGGLFSSYGVDGEYVGITEYIDDSGDWHYVPSALTQSSTTQKWGSKNDVILNVGFNFSDNVYIGVNLGLPMASYGYSETFYESATDPEQFPIVFTDDDGGLYDANFRSAYYGYQYLADMDGVYGKIGIIVTPGNGLRIGAAVQSPTFYTINEYWQYSTATYFTDNSFNASASSPEGNYTYNLISPYSLNLGLAYTFGTGGLLSVDYELTDYSIMRFKELHSSGYSVNDIFYDLNQANRYFAGLSHSLRVGAELRLTPVFSLRAGYNLITDPERYWINNEGETVTADIYLSDFDDYDLRNKNLVSSGYYGDLTSSYSLGIGFSTNGSFFADLGARLTRYPVSVFLPYYDYDNYDSAGEAVDLLSPRITNRRNLWTVALTLGWRF